MRLRTDAVAVMSSNPAVLVFRIVYEVPSFLTSVNVRPLSRMKAGVTSVFALIASNNAGVLMAYPNAYQRSYIVFYSFSLELTARMACADRTESNSGFLGAQWSNTFCA